MVKAARGAASVGTAYGAWPGRQRTRITRSSVIREPLHDTAERFLEHGLAKRVCQHRQAARQLHARLHLQQANLGDKRA